MLPSVGKRYETPKFPRARPADNRYWPWLAWTTKSDSVTCSVVSLNCFSVRKQQQTTRPKTNGWNPKNWWFGLMVPAVLSSGIKRLAGLVAASRGLGRLLQQGLATASLEGHPIIEVRQVEAGRRWGGKGQGEGRWSLFFKSDFGAYLGKFQMHLDIFWLMLVFCKCLRNSIPSQRCDTTLYCRELHSLLWENSGGTNCREPELDPELTVLFLFLLYDLKHILKR